MDILLPEHIGQAFILLFLLSPSLAELNIVAVQKHF
jgi:hypothetical protein